MAHLTNFSFAFFYEIFTEDASLLEAAHEKGTLWHFWSNLRFLDNHVAKDFKNTPLKIVLKYLDLSQSYDCFCNTQSA